MELYKWAADRLNGDGAVREPPYGLRVRRMSLCLPGYYGEMCSSAVPLVPVRWAGVEYEGSRPTCRLDLRDPLGLRHAVFAPFPR